MPGVDFLDGATPSEPVGAPAPEPTSEGPARGADGKFVSAEALSPPAPEPVVEAAPAPVALVAAEPAHAPLSALLDERERRQAAEKRIRDLEAQQQPAEPAYIDPDVENRLLTERLNVSEDLARDKFGDELVDAAKANAIAKFASSPAFQQEVLSQRNPYRYVVEWHQREQAMASLGDPAEVEAFKAWKAAQASGQPAPAFAAAPAVFTPPPVAAPPVSLASATSAGGPLTVPSGPGQAYDALFKG